MFNKQEMVPTSGENAVIVANLGDKKNKQERNKESRGGGVGGLNSLLNLLMLFFFFRTVCHLWLVLQSVKKGGLKLSTIIKIH